MNEKQAKLYRSLCTRSKRALKRKKKRNGKPYLYRPRGDLLSRLAEENDWTIEQAYTELLELRALFSPARLR